MFRKAIIAFGALGGLIALLFWWRRLTQESAPAGQAAYPTYWQPSAPEPGQSPAPPAGEIAGSASHAAVEASKTLLAGSSQAESAAAGTASADSSAAFAADQNAAAAVSVAALADDMAAEGQADAGEPEQAGAAQAAEPGEYAGPSTIDALFADNADAGASEAGAGDTPDESAHASPAGDTEGVAPADSVDQAEAGATEDTGDAAGAAPADDAEDQAETNAPPADDLIVIEGIGPKISTIVAAAGITSFAQLADTSVEKLAEILRDAKLPTANPSTWPDQARLAAEGKFDELKELQDRIRNGKLES